MHVDVIEVDPQVLPDNAFPKAYAVYLRLSAEPSAEWQAAFAHVMALKTETRGRTVTFPGERRMRLVVGPREHVESVLRSIGQAVRRTNARFATHHPEGDSPPGH